MPKRSWTNAVRKVVRQELPRPEWKCFQAPEAAVPLTVASNWVISDLTALIVQGVESSDRLGRAIRVHRVDFWLEVRSPTDPRETDIQVTTGFLRAEYPTQADPLSGSFNFDSLYDGHARAATVGDFLDPRFGKAPPRVDLQSTLGWHLYDIRRVSLCGIARRTAYVVNEGQPPIYGNVTNDVLDQPLIQTGTLSGGAPQLWTTVTYGLFPTRGSLVGNITRPLRKRLVLHKRWPGRGLKVDYTDPTDPDTTQNLASNHLYWWIVSSVPAGGPVTTPEPGYNFSFRIWFTDE